MNKSKKTQHFLDMPKFNVKQGNRAEDEDMGSLYNTLGNIRSWKTFYVTQKSLNLILAQHYGLLPTPLHCRHY